MPKPRKPTEQIRELTARERQVADQLALGATNAEISEKLEISVKTVDSHRGSLMTKLALRNNVELCLYAIRNGWVAPDGIRTVEERPIVTE